MWSRDINNQEAWEHKEAVTGLEVQPKGRMFASQKVGNLKFCYIYLLYLFICLFVCAHMPQNTHQSQRTLLVGISFLRQCESWRSNTDCQAGWQEPLLTEPSHQAPTNHFKYKLYAQKMELIKYIKNTLFNYMLSTRDLD